MPVLTPDGKLTPELVRPHLTGFGFEHHAQPRAISISQASEYGTVYSADEVRALADLAHEHGMVLHMDGARLANAAVHLGVPVREFTADAGVDVLCFGGTKNGMVMGEALVLFGDARTDAVPYVRKQSTQLASKMRFITAQFEAMLEGGLWLDLAAHANEMALLLAEKLATVPGVRITQRCRPTRSSRSSRTMRSSRSRTSSRSTHGTKPPMRCGSCARGTPSLVMSMRSQRGWRACRLAELAASVRHPVQRAAEVDHVQLAVIVFAERDHRQARIEQQAVLGARSVSLQAPDAPAAEIAVEVRAHERREVACRGTRSRR